MEKSTCRNCENPINNNFCSTCGEQQYRRIVMKDVIGDFLSNLLAVEGPILRTVKDLTIRPGKMINDYLNGNRKVYYKPFQYYILATTVYFIFFYMWGDEMMSMISDMGASANTYGTSKEINAFQVEMEKFQTENMKFFTFLQVPIYSWLIWLFFRKKSEHSFTETFVTSLYVLGQGLLFGIVFTFFEFVQTGLSFMISTVFMVIYLPWVFKQLYNESTFKTILKSTAIIALAFILFGLLMAIVSLIWINFFR
jgi:Protein of unknown function (DUF3667)